MQGLCIAYLDYSLAQHLVLVHVVQVDFTNLPFDTFGMWPPALLFQMSSTLA
jgi:hypothetical protein